MAPTIAELEQLLKGRGFNCTRMGEDVLSIHIPTKAYRNTKGKRHIDVCVRFDSQHNCLVMESHWAFDTSKTAHKQAVLDCVQGAASLTPLIRPQHDPQQGEVKLRVDSLVGTEGISSDNVVRLLGTIPAFAVRVPLSKHATLSACASLPTQSHCCAQYGHGTGQAFGTFEAHR